MLLKRTIGLMSALTVTMALAACGGGGGGSSNSGSGNFGDCKITSKANSIKLTPVKSGTLTVETTLPAQGWWNGTTPQSIKSGYEYCMAAELANKAGLKSVTESPLMDHQVRANGTPSTTRMNPPRSL